MKGAEGEEFRVEENSLRDFSRIYKDKKTLMKKEKIERFEVEFT